MSDASPIHSVRAREALLFVAVCAALGLALVEGIVRWGGLVDQVAFVRPPPAVRVVDRSGETLRVVRVGERDWRWVPLTEVSPTLISAVLAAEDARFFAHRGVDVRAIARAAASNLLPWRRRSGASTITQQLVKLVYGRPNGLWDKGIEALRAIALERVSTKDEVLEQYLNRLPYGDGIVGVARACEAYLGHGPERMTAAEAALIAGIPQAPARTEPRRHLRRALARRAMILDRMRARGWIDDAEWRAARSSRAAIVASPPHPFLGGRFTDVVVSRWRRGELMRRGGVLSTSLHAGLQRDAEALMRETVESLRARGAENGAAVVVRNATGELYAYVGAARPEGPGGAMDLLRRPRQPGSTLKPFVYERFFELGGGPSTIVSDVARRWRGLGGAQYDARDYDGRERGPVSAREALAASLNLAALDVAGRVGQERLAARLRALRFARVGDADSVGAAAVLGGVDVTPLELAAAYVALARGGSLIRLAYAPEERSAAVQVMQREAVALTTDVLSDGAARAAGFGGSLEGLSPEAPFALKTGTSSAWRDAWCAVYDDQWTVLVWIGDPAGGEMSSVSGFAAAAPAAVRLLRRARAIDVRDPEPEAPRLRSVEICSRSGLVAGPRCAHTHSERFDPGRPLPARCDAHDAEGRDLVAPRFGAWITRHHALGLRARTATGAMRISSPEPGARLLGAGSRIRLVATADGAELDGVRWFVDEREVASPWSMTVGPHTLRAEDGRGRRAASRFEVIAAP